MPETTRPRVILASTSPRRRAILELLGLAVEVRPADIDEQLLPGERPAAAAVRLARAKAQAVSAAGSWVVAADTIVVGPDGQSLGKPASAAEASAMLNLLQGCPHQVITAQTVRRGDDAVSDRMSTLVTMRAYSAAEVTAYLATGDPYDKAGAYAIQHPTFRPVATLNGCYLNVVGLAACRTARLLREMGYSGALPDPRPPWCSFCRRAAAGEVPELGT